MSSPGQDSDSYGSHDSDGSASDRRKDGAPRTREPLIKTLTEALGLIAGLAGVVYAIGALIMVLRLARVGTPTLVNVIGNLPRELLISAALLGVVLPAAAFGMLYLFVRLLPGARPLGKRSKSDRGGWADRLRWLIAVSLLVAILMTGIASLPLILSLVRTSGPRRQMNGEPPLAQVIGWLVGAAAVQGMFIATFVRARATLARAYPGSDWGGARPVALMSLMVGFTVVPSLVLFSGGIGLTRAVICQVSDATPQEGFLIGESRDRVYLVTIPADQAAIRLVESYPFSRVQKLVLGESATQRSCGLASRPP